MGTGVVYILNNDNEIVNSFEMDYNQAINQYWGKRNKSGRYFVGVKGVKVPYKKKGKNLKDVIRVDQHHQEA